MHPRGRGRRGIHAPATSRAGSGVCRQYVHVLSANSRASCARPFGLFLRLLAATWREPGEKQSAAVPAAEAFAFDALDPGPLCEAAKVGWKRPRAPHAVRARTARIWRQGRMPCRQTPADRSEPAASPPARNRGCISLVTFFVQAKKVTRPPGRRMELNRDECRVSATRDKKAKALGPRLRGDDE